MAYATIRNLQRHVNYKASIRDFCRKTLKEKSKKPYDLIADLIGGEFSGQGNLTIDSEEILRKAFRKIPAWL
jgi:exopolysaccharide biosynthesis predicted pyruvyltransferase EpsI